MWTCVSLPIEFMDLLVGMKTIRVTKELVTYVALINFLNWLLWHVTLDM